MVRRTNIVIVVIAVLVATWARTPERSSKTVSGLFLSLLKTSRTKAAAPQRDYL
jgi:hypothetical protein